MVQRRHGRSATRHNVTELTSILYHTTTPRFAPLLYSAWWAAHPAVGARFMNGVARRRIQAFVSCFMLLDIIYSIITKETCGRVMM